MRKVNHEFTLRFFSNKRRNHSLAITYLCLSKLSFEILPTLSKRNSRNIGSSLVIYVDKFTTFNYILFRDPLLIELMIFFNHVDVPVCISDATCSCSIDDLM